MDEYGHEGNPSCLEGKLETYQQTNEFDSLAIVELDVSESEVTRILYPAQGSIKCVTFSSTYYENARLSFSAATKALYASSGEAPNPDAPFLSLTTSHFMCEGFLAWCFIFASVFMVFSYVVFFLTRPASTYLTRLK